MDVKENLKPDKKKHRSKSSTTTKEVEKKLEKRKIKSHKEKKKLEVANEIKTEAETETHLDSTIKEERPKTNSHHKKTDLFMSAFNNETDIEENLHALLDSLKRSSSVQSENLKILFENLISLPKKFHENLVPENVCKLSGQLVEQIAEKSADQSTNQQFDLFQLWLNYLHTANPYYLELLMNLKEDPLKTVSDQKKLIFLNDLYNFLITVKDSRNAPFTMTAEDEENFGRLIEDPLKSCLLKTTNVSQFTEPTNNLLKLCLETGPGNTAHFYRPIKVNVFDRIGSIMLKILFDHDGQQTFSLNIIRQNMKLLVNIFVLNHKHRCSKDQHSELCTCYEDDPKMELYSTVENYVFMRAPKSGPGDIVLYLTDVIRKYERLAPYQWLDFVRSLYPQATNEVEKNIDIFFNVLKSTDPNYDLKMQSTLQLLQNISHKNPYLFNVGKITILENQCLFNDRCSNIMKNLTLHIFHEISQRNCDPFFKTKGQMYYQVADSINIDSMMTVNNLLKNVGLCNQQECERVVSLMEKEIVKNEDNKTFVQHMLITWKDMVMENASPFKKRRNFIKKFVDDPKLSRNAKDILALSEPDSKTCVVC